MVDLLPCPFCGGTNLKSGGDDKFVGVRCLDCETTGPNHYNSRFDWDIRQPAPGSRSRGGWSYRRSIPEDGFECYFIDYNGVEVGSINGPQSADREALVAALVATAPRALDSKSLAEEVSFIITRNLTLDWQGRDSAVATRAAVTKTSEDIAALFTSSNVSDETGHIDWDDLAEIRLGQKAAPPVRTTATTSVASKSAPAVASSLPSGESEPLVTTAHAGADTHQSSTARGAWLPIETAPKDGSKVDLHHPAKGRLTDCFWHKMSYTLYEPWGWGNQFNGRITGASHWMPTPAPPRNDETSGGAQS